MRLTLTILVAVLTVGVGVPAFADLQNVEVGGGLQIRTNWYSDPDLTFSDNEPSDAFTEQRTRINVGASFTDNVDAFIELDEYSFWGQAGNLRGNPVNGLDQSSMYDTDEVDLYQAYIDVNEAGGYPINIRTGRQEIQLGSEWLVGNNDTGSLFRGLSFDGIVGTYVADEFTVSAFFLKLIELGGIGDSNGLRENDEDTNLYGIYGTYNGLEDMTVDVYWLMVDAARLRGSTDADSGGLHTIGARVAGTASQFDWEAEGAYQTGDAIPGTAAAVALAAQFSANTTRSHGSPHADVNAFGFHGEVGYTFDMDRQPRVFLGGAYYDGGDIDANGDVDAPFNRLFSDHEHSEFLANTDLSNVWLISGGASAQMTEELELSGVITYFSAVEDYNSGADEALGFEVGLYVSYQYSEDLAIEAGYAHFFTDDGIEQGNAVLANGTGILGGGGSTADEDQDYFFVQSSISF